MCPDRPRRRTRGRDRPVLRLGVSLALTLLIVVATPLTREAGLLADLEARSLDARFRLRGAKPPGPDVALLMIDEKTVQAYGRWPLPRERLAEAVRRLASEGAAVIGFDLLFLEEGGGDRLPGWAEEAIRGAIERGGADRPFLETLLRRDPSDGALAEAFRSAGNVLVPYAFLADPRPRDERAEAAIAGSAFTVVRTPRDGAAASALFQAEHAVAPERELMDAAVSSGHVTVVLAADGSLRHHYPVIGYQGEHFPSLPIGLARLYRRLPKEEVAVFHGAGIDFGGRLLPTDDRLRFHLDYYGPEETFPTWSLVDLLEGRFPEGAFRDRIVLIGSSAAGASGHFPTPFTQTMPGTEYFATAVQNILDGDLLRRDDLTAGIDLLGIVGGGMLAAGAGYFAPAALSATITLLLLLGWGAFAYLAFAALGLWIGVVLPGVALVLNFTVQEIWGALIERRRRRAAERQRLNLSRYFAPAVVDALAEREAPIGAAHAHDAAVLFVDLSGFTGLCERLPPAEVLSLLRRFHAVVERAVFAHGGTLDKFIGDGALAVFGVPVPGEADAAAALCCARRLLADVGCWNEELTASGTPIGATIGIHFGPVLAGDVGGERQFQYTVTGDTVNVASRLQALCREFGVCLVVSDAAVGAALAASACDGSLLRELGLQPVPALKLRGRERPIAVWTGERVIADPFSDA